MGSIQSYTKAALDALLNGKSDLSHTHAAGLAMSGSWNTLGAIPSIAWWSVQIDVAKLG